jgi:hypothetical protein
MIATVYGERARFCDPGCRDSFKCDRAAGLVYGPTRLQFPDGSTRWAKHREEVSILCHECAYCGAAVVEQKARVAGERTSRVTGGAAGDGSVTIAPCRECGDVVEVDADGLCVACTRSRVTGGAA